MEANAFLKTYTNEIVLTLKGLGGSANSPDCQKAL
jgi:hypothetical protein